MISKFWHYSIRNFQTSETVRKLQNINTWELDNRRAMGFVLWDQVRSRVENTWACFQTSETFKMDWCGNLWKRGRGDLFVRWGPDTWAWRVILWKNYVNTCCWQAVLWDVSIVITIRMCQQGCQWHVPRKSLYWFLSSLTTAQRGVRRLFPVTTLVRHTYIEFSSSDVVLFPWKVKFENRN